MSDPNIEEAKTSSAADEAHSLDGNEKGDVNIAATSLSTPITSEEVARQIRATNEPLTGQLEILCDFMLELHKNASPSNEKNSTRVQGHSRPCSERFLTLRPSNKPSSQQQYQIPRAWSCCKLIGTHYLQFFHASSVI